MADITGGPPAMIKTIEFSCDGRTYPIQYPFTPIMEAVVTEILGGNEYPLITFLRGRQGAVLDIGASIGCASLMFSIYYPEAIVYAFEPSPNAYNFLQLNTHALPNVRCFNYGLYNKNCRAKLHAGEQASVTSSIVHGPDNSSGFEMVELRKASSFIADGEIGRILMVKLDTEGAEVPILRDIAPLLDRVEAIMLEYHSERDRLEIDQLLAGRFSLISGKISHAHRGNLVYLSKDTVSARTNWDQFEIPRLEL